MSVDPQALRELRTHSRDKKRRMLVNVCPGCTEPLDEPTLRGRQASATDPIVIDYFLCPRCAKKIMQGGRKAQLFADRIDHNLEALGAFDNPPGAVSA